jgi:hypothetical protein
VKFELVKNDGRYLVRLTAGAVTLERERLYYGDGKVAIEVEATPEGIKFHGVCGCRNLSIDGMKPTKEAALVPSCAIDGSQGAAWIMRSPAPPRGSLKGGCIYAVNEHMRTLPLSDFEK